MLGITDIHSHIIPGVDDGAESLEISMEILRESYASGVRQIILTPHFRLGMFETSGQIIRKQFENLNEAAKEVIPALRLYPGCEFHASMDQEGFLSDPRFFLAGSRYLLLEFSGGDTENFIRDRIRAAQMSGAKVIIAHAERISAVRETAGNGNLSLPSFFSAGNLDFVQELRRSGAMIQLNADAVLGMDGQRIKKLCHRLIRTGLADFIASDVHNLSDRRSHLGECADLVSRKYGEAAAKRIFIDNPGKILSGKRENT